MKLTFSVNRFDNEGDVIDNCILLHINETTILKLVNMEELNNVIKQLENIKNEITENYNI
jgi:hypothetical protein